jgi:acyl dehydratase
MNPRIPNTERYFEDYTPGMVVECGEVVPSEEEILEFGRRFDPQDMHADPEKAKSGPFGGLIASGWHTAALTMRLVVDRYLSKAANIASPGLDELRWKRPVRPGDRLRVRVSVLEARPSRSRPDRGIVTSLVEVFNQKGELVMSLKPVNLMRCRPRPLSRDDR